MMNGKKTLVTLAITLISVVCAALGIDFGAILVDTGYTPDAIAEAVVTETPGWLNLVIASGGIVLAAIFRIVATRMLVKAKPPAPPGSGFNGLDGVNGLALMLGAVLMLQLFLAGCAVLPQPVAPKSVKQSIASAYIAIGAARGTAADLLSSETISLDKAVEWSAQLNDATATLDLASAALSAGDLVTAESKLNAAQKLLGIVQHYLKEKIDERSSAVADPQWLADLGRALLPGGSGAGWVAG